jgi:phenylalanyl-tRNA synthetase alpha chain
MPEIDLKSLKIKAKKELENSSDLRQLEEVFKKYLGKKGEITLILRSLEELPKEKRAKIGGEANDLKGFIKMEFEKKKAVLTTSLAGLAGKIDITAPAKKSFAGHLHPLTLITRKAEEIFQSMGFSVIEGPEIESEWYNFDALNIPKDHPARDAWDTFYLKNGMLLRTHTSPVQIRYMEKNQPPLRIIVPGRIFRHEATDASHEFDFNQLEGLMIGKDISAANFKALIQEFYRRFFGKPVKIRLIPSFFPFVEPGFQVDISCLNCAGKGCPVCKRTGWLEMMGAGMVHPDVYKYAGLNPKGLTGFAFGMGLERLAMMKYKINDIRLFHSGDIRFLQQF